MDATFLAAQGDFTLSDLTPALLVGSLVLLVSVAAVRLSVRSGLPSLLIYLAIGLAIGEAGLGIRFDSAELTQVLGYAALILILAEGGLTTRWEGIRRSVAPAAALATVGVVVSVAVVGLAARLLLRRARSVEDPLSGFFAVRRDVVADAPLRASGFKILLEILVVGRWRRAVEVPLRMQPRAGGESKAGIREGLTYGAQLLRLLGASLSLRLRRSAPARSSA